MNASKEEARKANGLIEKVAEDLDRLVPDKKERDEVKRRLIRIRVFVEAAERKLPTEASYKRAKARPS